MKFILYIIQLFFIGLLIGCLEPYEPEIASNPTDYLVVDGVITSKSGPYTIKITKTFDLDVVDPEEVEVTGLNLVIEEENGLVETLDETSGGNYQTISLQGKVGNRYRLKFNYNGNQYQSSWEEIYSSTPIDSVYYSVETKQTTNKDEQIKGVQFYLDSHGSSQDATYYRYEWEETWEIGVFYPSLFDYLGNDNLEEAINPLHTCWKHNSQTVINIATSEGLTENQISRNELDFITGENERFIKKYSLLVKQYALDESEYLFWKALQESNEQLGSLYDKQPGNIKGNITNLSSPSEIVLGYFSASGLQEERIFITELKDLSRKSRCGIPLDTLLKEELGDEYEQKLLAGLNRGKLFYDFVTTMTEIEPLGALLSDPICSDCRLKGGDVNKPNYWDE
jgi:uncharacterized protein DUF4249